MKLDVIDNTSTAERKDGLNLLEKTELWINNITLSNANLTQLAGTVAATLGLNSENILVVDVRPGHITLDILEPDIPLENITGKEREILNALSGLEGVNISEEAYIHSNGILGLICLTGQDTEKMKQTVHGMVDEITEKISRRAIIFSTGFEVKQNIIEDTNSPYLKDILEQEGYEVTIGPVLEDDMDDMIFQISDAVSKAYGLIITTGGVGAEDKDKTVESIKIVDPAAETPYIVRFDQGTGRHVKDGVKIAVSFIGPTRIISLPGPNDEVRVASRVLLNCLKEGCGKKETADRLAHALAQKLINKKHISHHNHTKEVKHGL
ncbi:MAG TPA: molybdopterin-binding protein [Eubacteriaceae bacterium]|nr:molybdopterin-binding protein [Eubacteriaceae bacterium]